METKLLELHAANGPALRFDDSGLIVCTPENWRNVITALFDHRLASAFSENFYDVPGGTKVN